MTLAACTADAARRLTAAGLPAVESRRDAVLLARWRLGWSAATWLTRSNEPVPPGFAEGFAELVERRTRREPLAYITGEREFYGRPFKVTRDVLIPRQETEVLVDLVLQAEDGGRGVVVDVGTGSGAIALALATEGTFDAVIATDVSLDALAVAEQNAAFLRDDLRAPVELLHGSLLAPVRNRRARAVVSNPPYVATTMAVPDEVVRWEPAGALWSGEDGLDDLRLLVAGAGEWLTDDGALVCELSPEQVPTLRAMAQEHFAEVRVEPDLSGRDRALVARRALRT